MKVFHCQKEIFGVTKNKSARWLGFHHNHKSQISEKWKSCNFVRRKKSLTKKASPQRYVFYRCFLLITEKTSSVEWNESISLTNTLVTNHFPPAFGFARKYLETSNAAKSCFWCLCKVNAWVIMWCKCVMWVFFELWKKKNVNLKHLTSKLFSVSYEEARETFCCAEISRGTEEFCR